MDIQQQVENARNGDHRAFLQLMKHMEGRLYRIAHAMVKRQEDIVDVMQETIISAYEALPQLRESHFFETWVIRILINQCNLTLRKRKQIIPFSEIRQSTPPHTAYDSVDIRQVVDQLEEDKRQLIILHYFQDIPLRQVAEILDISESTAKTRLHRIRKLLSRWIEDQEEGGHTHEKR
ncbi:sigma-70 family RNA polymerase sigma factor [Paenibacillus bovis]|uniref:RNA polymerase n=1 Tax=Paenibacillus bovis TaxID=1616788 RepID=A0A172ZCD6_9BACL|nr:sigma-70 family RNA polymerase sigma factor [Paenibacillus bovis]ANF94937.1 hypothetical protein AR543_02065 [Paenibacillus bovis]